MSPDVNTFVRPLLFAFLALCLAGYGGAAAQEGESARKAPPAKQADDKQKEPRITMTASEPRLQRPEPELLPDFVYWEVTLRFKNEEMKEVVLCPFIHVKVLDAKKKEVESDAYIGAGFVSEELIDDIDRRFVVVPAGKTAELAVNLGNNDMGDHLIGWDFEQAGTYTVQLSYDYDRNAFQKTFFQAPFIVGKEKLDWARAPERNWNRAVEMKRTAEVMLVKPK